MSETTFFDESRLLGFLSYAMVIFGIVSGASQAFKPSFSGRYSVSTEGSTVPGKISSYIHDLPTFALPCVLIYIEGVGNIATVNQIFLVMLLFHYFQRSFIYSALIRGGKPVPLEVFISSLVFASWNGYLQGRSLAHLSSYPSDWMQTYNFRIGVLMFLMGMFINIHSDHILQNLRKPGETGYKIPRGGLFDYVSGANFFGEIVEWTGFAIASWSLHGSAFAIFTALNIGPRAVTHHKWYKKKFAEYPKSRKALIPYLL